MIIKKFTKYKLILVLMFCSMTSIVFAQNDSYAVMDIVEVEFNSQVNYGNAYMDVDVWIELKKEGSSSEVYRIPVFWDGGNVFRVRLVPTSPGTWTWKVINETVENADRSFIGRSGSFTAVAANVSSNPNKRGFIRVASNNRTLEYADGTPFFYTADTSWSALTEVFGFSTANNISGISFQDYVKTRKGQGFNGLNVIASFPNDSYTELWAEKTHHKKTGPNGEGPFELKSTGQVDYLNIKPEYWQSVDKRMQHLSDQGFVTLFETVRRSELWYLGTTQEKAAFYNYVRYLWARYGCYNMIFSWVHHDSQSSIYPKWEQIVSDANSKLYAKMGDYRMPYGQPRTAMSFNTSLNNWERDIPTALDIQNVSNAERDETMHEWLRNIYYNQPAKPALNLEPFYPGWGLHSGNEINAGMDDTTMAQMQMYGSVLSGGLAGHAWGDAWYAGAATSTSRSSVDGGTIVPSNDPQVNALKQFESQSMGHLKSFILDSDHNYAKLVPAADTNLSDSEDYLHTLAIADDKSFALGFFTADSRDNAKALPSLKNLIASTTYQFQWWDVTNGGWISAGNITTSSSGTMKPPVLPNNDRTKNWAYRIQSTDTIEEIEEEETEVEEPVVEVPQVEEPVVEEPKEEEPKAEEPVVEEPKEEPKAEVPETETNNDFVLRINSGGDEMTLNGDTFSADNYSDAGLTLDRPQTGLNDPFKTFRYSRSQVLGYDIPLENGEYTVKLHFAELWFGATDGGSGDVGNRVFDVRLEGVLAEDNLDVFAQVGAEALLTKTHTVNVTDGKLDIDFSSLSSDGGTRHPIINAIEIFGNEEIAPIVVDDVIIEKTTGLVGHWPLDELNGVIANDASGQDLNGALDRGVTFDKDKTNGKIEGALVFDGVDDHINLPDIDNNLESSFSVSAWVNPSNAEGSYQGIVGSSTSGGFMMFVNKGKLGFTVSTSESGRKLISEGIIQNNVWQMITCTFDGSEMRWYINGENIHSEAFSGTLKDKDVAWIGWSGWSDEYFEGAIDDVKLFNNSLTKQQVSSLFEEGSSNVTRENIASKIAIPMEGELDMEVFRIFPNPTNGVITVTGMLSGMQLDLIDFSGRKVASQTVTVDGDIQMDLSPYAKGAYVLNISNGKEVLTGKVILN